jgi:hypothetical protein
MTFSRTPELLRAVRSDAQLEADFKANPVATLERVTEVNTLPDTWLYRLVVLTFALSMFAVAGNRGAAGESRRQRNSAVV